MADNKVEKEVTKESVPAGGAKPEVTAPVANNNAAAATSNKPLIISITVAVLLAVALLGTIATIIASNVGRQLSGDHRMGTNSMMRPGQNTQNRANSAGPESGAMPFGAQRGTADSSTRVNGVVTAINGDTITVAGNGKTISVKKTGTTTVRGTSSTIAVNDTISAVGATNDQVFTATTITIRNSTVN